MDQLVAQEFVTPPDFKGSAATRRQFLGVMGASLALSGVQGCAPRQPDETIVPYVRQPEQLVPGKPLYYATAMEHDQWAAGLLVETHMARPTKVEGNPIHPCVGETMAAANERLPQRDRLRFGPTTTFAQASVLTLYDPERSQTVKYRGRIQTWDAFVSALKPRIDAVAGVQGDGLCILTETVLSPTLASQLGRLQEAMPRLRWVQWEPVNRDNELLGIRMAFGEDLAARFHLDRAKIIVSLDADFLTCGSMPLQDARGFAAGRRPVESRDGGNFAMNRLYVVESGYTVTGAAADHRMAVRPEEVETFARLLATELALDAGTDATSASEALRVWARVVAADLREAQAAGVATALVAGRWQSPVVHAIAHWINSALGNVGRSLEFLPPAAHVAVQDKPFAELTAAMDAGEVDTLLILGGNPVYSAPADLPFAASLEKVPFTAHLGLYEDETAVAADWHIPQNHFLESWSDTQAPDGTVSIVQPLLAPLYGGRTAHEIVAKIAGASTTTSYDLVREHWRRQRESGSDGDLEFEAWWQQALHDGVAAGTSFEPRAPEIRPELEIELRTRNTARGTQPSGKGLIVAFRPDASVWDGRHANNAWLQELPRPISKITWDNAALISPSTARENDLSTGDVVELKSGDAVVQVPIWILPGQPKKVVGLQLGYGRSHGGEVARGVGVNVYPLRRSDALWFAAGTIRKLDEKHQFAATQHHHLMEGRHLVRHGTLQEFEEHPEHPPFVHPPHHHAPDASLYPAQPYASYQADYQWGMSVDLSSCIGCSACVVACQAENNIPVVGKEQVALGREMHWIRIDHYFSGQDNPQSYHQPVMCQHCELAPCEVVCPVAATTHSAEGLNEMTYNRCVGTRYCSNNCPYKVRRFNFFEYNSKLHEFPTLQLLPNPDVTVRSRGVMEKCTYCVQRINSARIHAEKEDRPIRDGEVITACQAACPTEAIVFGDLNDADSRVHALANSPLKYGLLEELNTRPRTTYLAVVKNLNPVLREPASSDSHD